MGGISINWGALGLVTLTALVATVVIVTSYSVGIRLLAVGRDDPDAPAQRRPPLATAGAVVCIAIGVAAVLYGIYLVIPLFHPAS